MGLKLREMGARCVEVTTIIYLTLMCLEKGVLLNLSG